MKYLGRSIWEMTQAEIDQLPAYHEAKAASYNLPLGKYRTISASTHQAALIEVVDDPQSKYNREIFNHVTIVKGHDCNEDNGTSCPECRTRLCNEPEFGDPHGDDENCYECTKIDRRSAREINSSRECW